MADAARQIVWKGAFFAIEKHPTKEWETAVRPPGVRLILHDAQGRILLTEEYRHELARQDYRLPGGKVFEDLDSFLAVRGDDAKLQEAVMHAARLEAKQETGVDEIRDLRLFHRAIAGASVEWDLYYCTGTIVAQSEQELEDDEKERGISVHFFSPADVARMITDGSIAEERTCAVLGRYLARA
jgi:8-oxo-dGTP pyrophosphatase MutT (NUDIX family)